MLGIPLLGRSKGILSCIGDVWGKVICVKEDAFGDLSHAKVQVDTVSLLLIKGWINLYVDDKLYEVHVRESNEDCSIVNIAGTKCK